MFYFFAFKCTDSNYFTTLHLGDHLAIDLFQDSRCDFTGQCGTRARQIGKCILLCRVNTDLHSLAYVPICQFLPMHAHKMATLN